MNLSLELKNRILTGVIGGFALLILIVFGGWLGVFFLTTLLSLGMVFEFTGITFTLSDRIEKRYVLLLITWFVVLMNLLIPQAEFQLLVITFMFLFGYFLLTVSRHKEVLFPIHFKEMVYSLFALVYLTFLPLYLPKVYEYSHGLEWTILFFLIVWSGDTGAYFVGKRYGQRKIYPLISPKKTVEGAIGGLASGLAVTLFCKFTIFPKTPWSAVIITPILVGATAQLGDLCESFFKRAFDIKDSGSILPGHGGFLDRFDGVVFSLPVMYACIKLLG